MTARTPFAILFYPLTRWLSLNPLMVAPFPSLVPTGASIKLSMVSVGALATGSPVSGTFSCPWAYPSALMNPAFSLALLCLVPLPFMWAYMWTTLPTSLLVTRLSTGLRPLWRLVSALTSWVPSHGSLVSTFLPGTPKPPLVTSVFIYPGGLPSQSP